MNKNKNTNPLITLIIKLKEDDILALASQLSYSLLLSLFPFLIFLFTVAGYSSVKSEEVLMSLKNILPLNVYNLIYNTVIEIFDSRKGNLLSFSLIITIWIASNGLNAVIKAVNKAYKERECRPFWKTQLISISFTIIFTFLIIFSLFLLVLGNFLGIKFILWFNLPLNFIFFWNFLRYVVTLIIMIFVFTLLYKVTPCKVSSFKEALPGSIFATFGWIIVSLGFAYYVDNFANYSRLYGSIGAVIALMVWLYLTSIIILIGGEINSLLSVTSNQ